MNTEKNVELSKYEIYLVKMRYDEEIRREDALIQQAGQMQSAFSFTTAALFMATPVMFQYRGDLSFWFIYASIASTVIVLLFSLFAATMAQNRITRDTFAEGEKIIEHIEQYEDSFKEEVVRNKYTAKSCAKLEKALTKTNNNRVRWIQLSMWAFYLALLICVLWFLATLTIVFLF